MTIKEVQLVINGYIKEKEDENKILKSKIYNQAYLTSMFVGSILGGKSVPPIEEIFPEFKDIQEEPNRTDIELSIMKDKLLDFAREANKRRK